MAVAKAMLAPKPKAPLISTTQALSIAERVIRRSTSKGMRIALFLNGANRVMPVSETTQHYQYIITKRERDIIGVYDARADQETIADDIVRFCADRKEKRC